MKSNHQKTLGALRVLLDRVALADETDDSTDHADLLLAALSQLIDRERSESQFARSTGTTTRDRYLAGHVAPAEPHYSIANDSTEPVTFRTLDGREAYIPPGESFVPAELVGSWGPRIERALEAGTLTISPPGTPAPTCSNPESLAARARSTGDVEFLESLIARIKPGSIPGELRAFLKSRVDILRPPPKKEGPELDAFGNLVGGTLPSTLAHPAAVAATKAQVALIKSKKSKPAKEATE